jgi:hypothetical protein
MIQVIKEILGAVRTLHEKGLGTALDVVFVSFTIWSLGFVSALGDGFARAEDSKFSLQLMLEANLMDVRIKQCSASDNSTRQFYTAELLRLKNLYAEKLTIKYEEPDCGDLVDASP